MSLSSNLASISGAARLRAPNTASIGLAALCLAVGLVPNARAQALSPICTTNAQTHLERALVCLNMQPSDFGFDKDMAKPVWTLDWIRKLLNAPLGFPAVAERVYGVAQTNDPVALFALAAELLEAGTLPGTPSTATNTNASWPGVPQVLWPALTRFDGRVREADSLLATAFQDVSASEREYLAACVLAGVLNVEDRPENRPVLTAAGIHSQTVERVIAEGLDLNPEPAATNFLALMRRVRMADLLAAGAILQRAAADLRREAAAVQEWPAAPVSIATPLGAVVVGSLGDDTYSAPALLILDPGGADRYSGETGAANGLQGLPLAMIIDLAGDDHYQAAGLLGAASALFGASVVMDVQGSDTYRAAYVGQAAAIFGVAWLEDNDGADSYTAQAHSQAAAAVGLASLRDGGGNDTYTVGLSGQAYAGVWGMGLLVDVDGHDSYYAGGCEPDHERNPERFITLSQGFAIGMRPFAGGGVAALVDLAGNDSYVADVYGQAVSYWYSAAFLLDAAGHDTYRMHQYGQGCGIHLSLGLLADGGGNDMYTGYWLVQGHAHDYAVGMLFDQGGDDTYIAEGNAQGRAINNSLALLVDSAGNDAYLARHPDDCQGGGNSGGRRDYGCLGLLLDLAGSDSYSCGATNGARLPRPLYGLVYDLETNQTAEVQGSAK